MLTLQRPLVILDLEATGTDPQEDRIIQVAVSRIQPEHMAGENTSWSTVVNPGCKVPDDILELTGISEDDLKAAFNFRGVEERLSAFLVGADVAGYNIQSYDWPLLRAEYERNGCPLPGPEDRKIVDAYQIEKRLRPRTLEAVFRRRTGQGLDDAHDAAADVEATYQVLEDQISEYQAEAGEATIADVVNFQRGDFLDPDHKLKETDRGVEVCFGKHSGKTLSELQKSDPGYLRWMKREISELRVHIEEALSEGGVQDEMPF